MNLLIADDHALFLEGLRMMIGKAYPGANIVEAQNGLEALRCVQERPALDLCLIDLHMPELDGLAFLARLDQLGLTLPVVVLSGSNDPADVAHALDAGALGYIPKQVPLAVLKSAVDQVLAGNLYVPATLAREVSSWRKAQALASTQGAAAVPANPELSPRQLDVLRLMLDGLGNAEIADRLFLSENTVKTHVASLLRLTGTANRTACTLAAVQRGWVKSG